MPRQMLPSRWRLTYRRWAHLAHLLLAAAALVSLGACAPTDEQLRSRFEVHKESFQELKEIAYLEARANLGRVDSQANYQIALDALLAANPRAMALLAEVGDPSIRVRPSSSRDEFQLWFEFDNRSRVPAF